MYVNSDEQNENDNDVDEGEEHIYDIMNRYIFKDKLDERQRKYFVRKKV